MVHHDVVRNSCPTSVKTFCQSILHSMDCKYMYDVLLYVIVYMYIFFKIRFIVLQDTVSELWKKYFIAKENFDHLVCQLIYKFWIFFYQYMHLSIFKKKPVSGYIYIVCFLAGLVSFSPFPTVADRSIQPLPVIHICQEKRRYAYGLNNFYIFYKNIICTCIFSFFSLSPLEYRWGKNWRGKCYIYL